MGPCELFFGVAIIVNIIVVFVQLELGGRASGAAMGAAVSGDDGPTLEMLAHVSVAFTAFFAFEQVLKLSFFRCCSSACTAGCSGSTSSTPRSWP